LHIIKDIETILNTKIYNQNNFMDTYGSNIRQINYLDGVVFVGVCGTLLVVLVLLLAADIEFDIFTVKLLLADDVV